MMGFLLHGLRDSIPTILVVLVASLFGASSTEAGLVAHWPFSSGDGFNDVVGGHNPDAVQNVNLGEDRFGDPTGAAEFTGTEGVTSPPGPTSYLRVPNVAALTPPEMTINLWFKHTKTQGDDGDPSSAGLSLIGNLVQIVANVNEPGYIVQLNRLRAPNASATTDNNARFAASGEHIVAVDAWTIGQWHMFTTTFDGTNLKLYIDSVFLSQGAATYDGVPSVSHLAIGATHSALNQTNGNFTGFLDDVMLYDHALSDAEITALFGVPAITDGGAGFGAPLDLSPVTVKKNRVIPFKVELLDGDGNTITDLDIASPPVIQVIFDDGIAPAEDVTDEALSAGQGTDGNQFEFNDPVWQFNLKTKNYTGSGTYTVSIVSGDSGEYMIDPAIEAQFVIP